VFPAVYKVEAIASEATRLNAVLTGSIDTGYITGASYPLALANKSSLQISRIPSLTVHSIWFNESLAPLNNVLVRRAITMAINRQAMSVANGGLCTPNGGSVFPR